MIMRWKATSGRKPVTIAWIIKSPITAISKALDLYSKCMINFSDNYQRPLMIMEAYPNSQQLPLSETDHHLIRGTSTRTTATATPTQVMIKSSFATTATMWPSPRMMTIHEDRTCSFRDDGVVCKKKLTDKICFIGMPCLNLESPNIRTVCLLQLRVDGIL
ncbi:hypothetical protein L1987_43340 [Smallanthus sonchifolius]|uniref:Uncharacterized protein n=1 Tax=Smallanthus sonchifolius TaxID=185202 RepID=A0ACB9GLA4_9ASTR|nr:hypothetical protein L1987_43340 [Smallanthus sonchifolius]